MPVLTNLNRCLQGLLPCTLLVVDFVGMSTAFSLLLAAKVTSWPNARGLAHEGVVIEDLTLEGLMLAVRWALQGVVLWVLALGRFGGCYRADVCLTVDACCFGLTIEGLVLEDSVLVLCLP